MAALEELRQQLDEIDDQIVKLYEDRMRICAQVGKYKIRNGRKVADRQREREKLQDAASKVSFEYNKKEIRKLYKHLMSMSRRLQYRQFAKAFLKGQMFRKKKG